MTATTATQAALKALAGTHDHEPPTVFDIFADFGQNNLGDDRAGWLTLAGIVAGTLATDMFIAKASCVMGRKERFKEWAYLTAAEFVGADGSRQHKQSIVGPYAVDWGRQAALDGVALALWGGKHQDMIYNGLYVVNSSGWHPIPGVIARAAQYKCSKQSYQEVRDEVGSQANDLIGEAALYLEMCRTGKFSGKFKRAWEAKTGGNFNRANCG